MRKSTEPDFLDFKNYNPKDPSAWATLWLEKSIPMAYEAKKAQLINLNSFSRRYLFPFIKCYAFALKVLVYLIKFIVPFQFRAPRLLHTLISYGLYWFVSPQANLLILRHFHLGSHILKFLSQNLNCENYPSEPLYPKSVWDIRPNMILQHDINLFNFVTYCNQEGRYPQKGTPLDLSAIKPAELKISDMPQHWTNILDVESAIELVTPLFQLLITEDEFWRASISLQLDETIATYFCELVDNFDRLAFVVNKHPLFPNSTLEASTRLAIHGLSTEILHETLIRMKAANTDISIEAKTTPDRLNQ